MKIKNIDRRLVTILLIVFVQIVGASMIFPILPLFAQNEFDLSPQVITLLGTAFFAAQFVAGPFMGRLSDKYGRVPVLIVSQIGTALSFVMLGLAPSAAFLFLARVLDGITGGNIIVAQAYVTDITPPEKRTESLGYIFAIFGLGFIFGPLLGGLLAAAFGPRVPYLIAGVVAFATVMLTRFTLNETLSPEEREANRNSGKGSLNPKELLSNHLFVLVMVVTFVGQFAFGLLQATFSLYSEAVLFAGSTEQTLNLGVGLLFAVVGIGQIITQAILIKPLLARYGDARLVLIGNTVRGVALLLFAIVTSPWLGALGSLLFAIGMGSMMPPLQSLATFTVADELRGGILGIYQSITSLAIIFSTAVAGIIFAISPTMPYWIGAGLSLLVVIPAMILVREIPAKKPKAAAVAAD
ncbi:MAG: MFS transporter [Ardenticatenaceae bacterium]